jgi:hypothetical protein
MISKGRPFGAAFFVLKNELRKRRSGFPFSQRAGLELRALAGLVALR